MWVSKLWGAELDMNRASSLGMNLLYIITVIPPGGGFVLNSSNEHNRLVTHTFSSRYPKQHSDLCLLETRNGRAAVKHVFLSHLQA